MTQHTHQLTLQGQEDTAQLAAAIASHSSCGDAILLMGDLGVGKTTFARFFIHSLTSSDIEVVSPTFTLLQTYSTPRHVISHFDLYRLQSEQEALELGIEDAFSETISLIEWPEIISAWLPKHRLSVALHFGERDQDRLVTLTGAGNWTQKLQTLTGVIS